MRIGSFVFKQRRLFSILSVLFVVLGILSLKDVPKDEDPRLPDWFATIVVVLPGGEVSQIDEMIARPINEKLKEIDEIKKFENTTRFNSTVFELEMKDSIRETRPVWDKVQRALDEIKRDFPAGTREPQFFESTNRLETILYAVSGSDDLIALKAIAEELKQKLLFVSGTSKVFIHGDPYDEIQVNYDKTKIENFSIPSNQIIQKILSANSGIPGGAIDLGGRRIPIITPSRLQNPGDIKSLQLMPGSGHPISLASIAGVGKLPKRFESGAFWNEKPALFVGVVAQHPIEIVDFGERVRAQVNTFKKSMDTSLAQIEEVSFNPDRTQDRISDLGWNLILGVFTVGLILLIWMGWKSSLVVSLFVPMISLVGFFYYSVSGGVLHQISLAAFVISLGQFIDNIIVIVEWIESKVQKGFEPIAVAVEAIDQFKKPMFFATGTNISAFIPMLLSSGSTAEFTFAIPFVSILTLITAWLMALFVVPIFIGYLFKFFPSKKHPIKSDSDSGASILSKYSQWVSQRPRLLTVSTFFIVLSSAAGFLAVKKQFFPLADRNQFVVTLEVPEGSSPDLTAQETRSLTGFILQQPGVESVAGFVAEEIPRFYYNVGMNGSATHKAELLVITKDKKENPRIIKGIHEFAKNQANQNFVLARNLEQGPPIRAPIEYKVFSEVEGDLLSAVSELEGILKKHEPGLVTKNDLGKPIDNLQLAYNQELLERFQISEDQLSLAILSATSGYPLTKYFEKGNAKDVRILTEKIESLDQLRNLPIKSNAFRTLRLKDLVDLSSKPAPAVIHRLNGQRMGRVLAWQTESASRNDFSFQMGSFIAETQKSYGVSIQQGGEVEGSEEANLAILRAIPLGLMILIVCLLLEFNSYRKLLIILFSVPLVIAGVTPGLLLGDAAFGFMSLLGVLALVGIVVNNSILLIESIDEHRAEGANLRDSISLALESRTRPILMTAVTTIGGLLPMAFEESTLWPPLALAMISGLVGSTLITLIFVPSLYQIFFQPDLLKKMRTPSSRGIGSFVLMTFSLLIGFQSKAEELGFQDVLSRVDRSSSEIAAAKAEEERMKALSSLQKRMAFLPQIGLQVESKKLSTQLTQTNGFGSFNYGKTDQLIGGIEVNQPLLNMSEMKANIETLKYLEKSAGFDRGAVEQRVRRQLVSHLIEYAKLNHTQESLIQLEKSILGIQSEIKKFEKLGLKGKSDRLNIELALSDNKVAQVRSSAAKKALGDAIRVFVPSFTELKGSIPEPSLEVSSTSVPRPELEAMNALLESQKSKLSSISLGYLPSLEVKARYLLADQALLDQKNWAEVGLVLKMPLFEGGTRAARRSVQALEIVKTQKMRNDLESKMTLEQSSLAAQQEEIAIRIELSGRNLRLAAEAVLEDKRNSLNGKVPIKDWLNSEIRLEEKKLEYENLKLDRIRLFYDSLYTRGIKIE